MLKGFVWKKNMRFPINEGNILKKGLCSVIILYPLHNIPKSCRVWIKKMYRVSRYDVKPYIIHCLKDNTCILCHAVKL